MISNTITEAVQERIRFPLSDDELVRRYDLVSAAMRERDIDLIIMSNDNQYLGGYVRYFLDNPAEQAYPISVLFTKDGEVFSINSGNPAAPIPFAWCSRRIKERFAAPYFRTLDYTSEYDARIMTELAKKTGAKRIGLIAPDLLNYVMVDYLRENSGAEILNFTRTLDEIKAVKSEEELERVYDSAKMHDLGLQYVKENARRGMYEYELRGDLKSYLIKLGSEEQLIMMGCSPRGKQAPLLHSFYQGRQIQEGDDLLLMIEANGPGGYYTELARTFCQEAPPQALTDIFATARGIQHAIAREVKPGVKISDIHALYQKLVTDAGFPPENRLLMHGQGYDLVEWPGFQADDEGILEENMVLAIHPHLIKEDVSGYCCDDYLVTKDGAVRMHEFPQELIVL